MIGQTMINVKASGARTRISTFLAGVFLLLLVVVLQPIVAIIPMAALVAVMVMVSVGTFDWHSIRPSTLRRMPLGETLVMVVTVAVVVATSNLAIGVVVGTVVAMVIFAKRVAHFATVTRTLEDDGRMARYRVDGELFFASSNDLTTQFRYADDPARVEIDLSSSHIWDASTVAALDAITTKYAGHGTEGADRRPQRGEHADASAPRRKARRRALSNRGAHQGMVASSHRVKVLVGPSGPRRATRTTSREPSSIESVPFGSCRARCWCIRARRG